jgi:hypothetical protein
VRLFKNAWFQKFARKEKISDAALCEAVAHAGAGLIDADLGGGLLKQRVARPGAGKSGGYRTLIFFASKRERCLRSGSPKTTGRILMRTKGRRSRKRRSSSWRFRMSKWTLS